MYFDQHHAAAHDRLRFVFNGAVEQHHLPAGSTFGDIARMYNDSKRMLHGNPIAIAVTLENGEGRRSRQSQSVSE